MSVDFNHLILDSLETMRLGEVARGERFKALAYKKAIDSLKRFNGSVHVAEDVKDVEGVGKKIYEKITEIVATGALKAAERMKETTNIDAYETLLKIHGIGPVKARELIAAGYRTVEALRAEVARNPGFLNETQKLGLYYYESGIQRIPRSEMEQHEQILLSALPRGLTGTIVGSYRRGAANSGDVDMLVTYENETVGKKAFVSLVSDLTKKGYIVNKLVSGAKKWMGYIQLPFEGSVARRLDLLLTPPEEFAYALLYFTGSDRFNVAFRRHCLELGYTLNEHSMKLTEKGTKKGVSLPPPMKTEKDIFAFVGLRFVPPTERVDGGQIVPL